MNETRKDQFIESFFKFRKELGEIMANMSIEELKDTEVHRQIKALFIILLEDAVGREVLIHYIIDILKDISNRDYFQNNLSQEQLDRVERIKKENAEFLKRHKK